MNRNPQPHTLIAQGELGERFTISVLPFKSTLLLSVADGLTVSERGRGLEIVGSRAWGDHEGRGDRVVRPRGIHCVCLLEFGVRG